MRQHFAQSGRASLSLFFVFMIIAVVSMALAVRLPQVQSTLDTVVSAQMSPSPNPLNFKTKFISFEPLRSLTTAQAQSSIRSFLGGQNVRAIYPVDVYTLKFEVTVEDGSYSPITAQVFVPKSETPGEHFPLFVYAAGTTGLDDRCSPLKENQSRPSFGNYINQMVTQASQGFVVVLPNYEGFDNPDRIHYYFNSDLEARVLLGVSREILNARQTRSLPIQPNTLFFGGYSQGGHASFAAADYVSKYTPELKISGIIGHGPTTNIYELLKDNPNLAPYLMYAYQAYYDDFKPEELLTTRELERLGRAKDLCVDQAFQYNSTSQRMTYNADFLAALLNNTVKEKYPAAAERMDENSSGTQYEGIPTLIVQGDRDPIVTIEFQKQFADQLCENNVPVTFAEYKGLDHFQSRMRSFTDTNFWIREIVNGQQVNKMCN